MGQLIFICTSILQILTCDGSTAYVRTDQMRGLVGGNSAYVWLAVQGEESICVKKEEVETVVEQWENALTVCVQGKLPNE